MYENSGPPSHANVCRLRAIIVVMTLVMLLAVSSTVLASTSPIQTASRMVLSTQEVGSGFNVKQQGFTPSQLAGQGTYSTAQLSSWGYEGGYERVFSRDFYTANGIQIASNAGVYRTSSGANDSLIYNETLCTQNGFRPMTAPSGLGNAAVMCTKYGTEDGYSGQLFFVVWRVGNYKGSITLSGVLGHVTATQALSLARREAGQM